MPLQSFSRKVLAGMLTTSMAVAVPVVASANEGSIQGSSSPVRTEQQAPVNKTPAERVPIEQVQIDSPSGSPEVEEQGKIRELIKAGLEALKRVNRGWYDTVISKAREGQAAFVAWWNSSVPGWIKGLFANIAASAIWEFISNYVL